MTDFWVVMPIAVFVVGFSIAIVYLVAISRDEDWSFRQWSVDLVLLGVLPIVNWIKRLLMGIPGLAVRVSVKSSNSSSPKHAVSTLSSEQRAKNILQKIESNPTARDTPRLVVTSKKHVDVFGD